MSSSIQGSSLCNYSDPKILKNDINIGMAPAILHLIVSDSQVGNCRAEVVMCILMQQRILKFPKKLDHVRTLNHPTLVHISRETNALIPGIYPN